MIIRFLGRSAAHAETADHWWREHRPAAPDLFTRELEKALRILSRLPDVGVVYAPKADLGVRRLLLQRTRFHVYYAVNRERLVIGVLAIWSCHRGRPPSLTALRDLDAAP